MASTPVSSFHRVAPPPPRQFVILDSVMDGAEATSRVLGERAVVGRITGRAIPRATLRDHLQAAMGIHQGRVVEVTALGRGIFTALLSDAASVAALCAAAPILAGGCALFIMPWYSSFTEDEFEARQLAPRFPLTLSLPSLPR